MDERQEKWDIPELIGEIFPEVMEQLVREYPPQPGDISRPGPPPTREPTRGRKEAGGERGIRGGRISPRCPAGRPARKPCVRCGSRQSRQDQPAALGWKLFLRCLFAITVLFLAVETSV